MKTEKLLTTVLSMLTVAHSGFCAAVEVTSVSASPGDAVVVMINMTANTEMDVIALDLWVTYNPNVLEAPKPGHGTLTPVESWTLVANTNPTGNVRLALYSTTGFTNISGNLAVL